MTWLERLMAWLKPTPPRPQTWQAGQTIVPPVSADLTLTIDDGTVLHGQREGQSGQYLFSFVTPPMPADWGATLVVRAPTYQPVTVRRNIGHPGIAPQWVDILLTPQLPAPLSRDAILSVKLTFQGLTFQHSVYGAMPLFEAVLPWCELADRQSIYAVKHAAGDTHAIVNVPAGRPLYDDPNQPYSADRFGPLDWTNGLTAMVPAFADLVVEQIREGFTPILFLDEIQATSFASLPLVLQALKTNAYGIDLTPYVIIMPGWDGVFYGWEPSNTVIPEWATLARSYAPECYLGIEFNVGHIPLGNGPADYAPGGKMAGFDLIAAEFFPWVEPDTPAGDSVWQVVARLTRPYHRPPDQPPDDDPTPPFYLAHASPRGPYFAWFFEFDEYRWVRGQVSAAGLERERQYLRNLGCQWVS